MLIRIKMELGKPMLPVDYRSLILSLTKKVLETHYPENYKGYYKDQDAIVKSFTFAVFLDQPKFEKDAVNLAGNTVEVTFSTDNNIDSILLYNSFIKSVGYSHPAQHGNNIAITEVNLDSGDAIIGDEAIIQFISPLVVRHHEKGTPDRYYIYDDEEFAETLKHVICRQLGHETDIELTPINPKKTVVKVYGVNTRSSLGAYKISGNREDLNRLLSCGMGSKRSSGFGMFRVLEGGV